MESDPNQNAINALNQISLQIAQLTKTISQVFPQSISVSMTAVSGSVTPTNYIGYLSVFNPLTGGTVKVGYYD
jgi:hypothetical protein